MGKLFRQSFKRVLGFTLIELLVAALMASIFLAATGGIVIQTMRVDREETGRTQVQAELTQAMQYIQQDLAEALYIYNDAEQPNGDGIPDLIEELYDPGWIRRPAGSIPVVAFWKLSPIPQACYAGDPTLQDIREGRAILPANPPAGFLPNNVGDWENIRRRRNIYTLVVYYLRRNYNNAGNLADGSTTPWEGNARITRFELQPFNEDCTARSPFFVEDPDPFQAGFLSWPRVPDDQTPIANQAGTTGGVPRSLVSNIFSSRQGSPQVAPACPQGYAFGGGKPASVTFSGLNTNENDVGFYVCVRRSAAANLPQDVIINITATAMERSNPGLFRRYIQDATSVDAEQISRYLTTMQTQVLSRGVFNRQA
ncbi:PulJ/GspJ family protein [Thermostichus vulcanus]|uniref:PddD domain-containing protein n=1 Tax=Thermostichus vulcanus str. 'Rupite' TaxID=2813851 RepID=A0ABT0C8H2_THEVL|nr:PddD domain-containing protein [Thermostichus vulcanus]MCJ2542091.1 PddD domain-containing protein [Thermostichus vulcanus str. 'Rupite']